MNAELTGRLLDHGVAMARVGGDEELLRELAALFLEEYPHSLSMLHAALERGDAKGVERSAHGLKGSVANFGAQFAVDAALRIEHLGRDQKLGEVPETLSSLESALETLKTELASL
jgi:HPt (histidine-containing phosphotransfer) domain-containing protein